MSETLEVADAQAQKVLFEGLPKTTRELELDRMRFVFLPPGAVDVKWAVERPFIDVNLNAVQHNWAWNSDKRREEIVPADSIGFVPAGGEFDIGVENVLPGFLVEFCPRFWADFIEREFTMDAAQMDFMKYQPDAVAASFGRAGISMMLNSRQLGEEPDRLVMESLAIALIARTCRLIQAGPRDSADLGYKSGFARTRLQRVKDYIEAHLEEPLGLIELADVGGMSISHFNRSFKQAVGVSPLRYVFARRVERAKDLLSKTDTPISHIALMCGFAGQSHLTKVFKQHGGVTPAAFRRASLNQ